MDVLEFVICYLSVFILLAYADDCKKQSPCSCKTSKGTIDLHKLADQGNPRFKSSFDPYVYTWEPCYALSCGQSAGVAVCQSAGPSGYVAGYQNQVVFSGNPDDGNLQMVYTGDEERKTTVNLLCADSEADFKILSADSPKQKEYVFQLRTKYACYAKSGLSAGSIMLIIFFVLLFVYFLAGFLFLKFAKGATGTELIPNKDFWSSLPGLVKDGVRFTCKGCKTDTTYSQI